MDDLTAVTPQLDPNPERLKFIQAIAERLAGESASAKRWSVAVTAALLVFATRTDHPWLVLAAGILVLAVSAVIDAYYLGAERAYRRLYEQAAVEPSGSWDLRAPLLDLPLGFGPTARTTANSPRRDPVDLPRQRESWRRFARTLSRGMGPTIIVFYLGLIIPMAVLLVLVVIGTIQFEGASS